jgi:glycerol-3-phosphate dehydrogenase (NAD(P)+)
VTRIAILGAGSWGTALAMVFSRSPRDHEICLWARDAALAESIRSSRENRAYLPGHKIPAQVRVTHKIDEALADATLVCGAVPAAYARAGYSLAARHLSADAVIVSATKGLEPATHQRISEVIAETVPQSLSARIAVLSGPSFAAEAAAGQPTAVVIAARDAGLAAQVQEELAAPAFRLYTNEDVVGVELAGATKNVIAIAAGVCQGLGLGSNALAALITRGLAEMARLVAALGGRSETLSGLAGLGDLVLTCNGSLSRNRQLGIELAQGRALDAIVGGMRMVAEGVGTAPALLALAVEARVELPITEQVEAILHRGKAPSEAIRDILERPLKRE